MKAIVESRVGTFTEEVIIILNIITGSTDESDLRKRMKLHEFHVFTYGFGSGHMWVSHPNGERVIFVEL